MGPPFLYWELILETRKPLIQIQQSVSCMSTGNANCVEYLLEQKYVRSMEGNLFSPVHCSV